MARNRRQRAGEEFNELAEMAAELSLALDQQGFQPERAEFLRKQLAAMESIARIHTGAALTFFEQVANLLDIEPVWIPEQEFERALALIDRALPGAGDVRTRYQAWQECMRLPIEKADLLAPLMREMLDEAQRRTRQIIDLPEGEMLAAETIRGVNYGAANWYQGGFRSKMELNIDRPVYLFSMLYQMCHEGYPGHHTESCLKEKYIFQEQGYLEQSLFFSFGPQLVIAEGIASCAPEMIFTPVEAAEWMQRRVLPLLGSQAIEADLELMLEAFTVISPDDMGSNLAILIEAGRTQEEILEYGLAYSPYSAEQISSFLPWLDAWLSRIYSFTYSHGKRLIRPGLSGSGRQDFIRKILTEQVLPSRIRSDRTRMEGLSKNHG